MSVEPKRHFEVKSYTLHSVEVFVQIDYAKGEISLVDGNRQAGQNRWSPKQWIFSNRTIEYMQGWRNILAAMENAIDLAEKDLKKHLDAEAKEKAELLAEVARQEKKK